MTLTLRTPFPALVALGSVAAVCVAAAVPGAAGSRVSERDVVTARVAGTATLAPAAPIVVACARGGAFVAPGAALAAQLALDPARALMVLAVSKGSPAAEAGLEPFDVVVEVGGLPATPAALEAAAGAGGHVELTLVRGGEPHVALLGATAAPAAGFVTQESLAPEHPILQLRQLERLEALLERQAHDVDTRRQEVRDAQRATRDAAREAARAAHTESVEEARRFLEDRAQGLRAAVDAALDEPALDAARALALDLDGVLPRERVAGIAEALHDVAHVFEDDLAQRIAGQEGDDSPLRRHSCALSRLASSLSSRAHERVQKPWADVAGRHEGYAQALGERHEERMEWASERVEEVRRTVHERLEAAVERSVEGFSKALSTRLQELDVPRATEVVRALDDVSSQLDAWAMAQVEGVRGALDEYVAQVAPDRERLAALAPTHLEAGDRGHLAYAAAVERVFAAPAPEGAWESRAATRRHLDDLHARLLAEINAARDALRPEALGLLRDLEDERRRSDEAWEDLRDALKRLGSRSSEDGWRIEGPNLDGRHDERPRGEVVMAD